MQPGNLSSGSVLDRKYLESFRQGLGRITSELNNAVYASGSYIYTVGDDQTFTPLVASGSITEAESNMFFSRVISPDTDMLANQMLAHPTSIVSNQVRSDQRIIPSILTEMNASSAMVIPIVGGKELAGLLLIVRGEDRGNEFTPSEISMAEWFAVAIAQALENARLYHQTQNRLTDSYALHQVTLAILQKLQLEEVLQIICDEAQRMTYSSGSSIALLEGEDWLRVMYCAGETTEKLGRVSVERSPLGKAIHRADPLIVNNLFLESKNKNSQSGSLSMLAIPLRVQGNTIGILAVIKAGGFIPDDISLMRAFAGQAAVAIDHAKLTRQVNEMAIKEERHRLSRELHDSVNQLLYSISLYTEAAQRKIEKDDITTAQSHLKNIGELVQEALKEMRMLIFELRPSLLGQMGLQESLSQRLKAVEEHMGLQSSFKWRVNAQLDNHVEEALYGITQEALNNIMRHAQARSTTVHLVQSGETLILRVEDDGVGFDLEKVSSGGIGLKSMRERAENLGAHLNIDSQPGKGTRIIVEVKL